MARRSAPASGTGGIVVREAEVPPLSAPIERFRLEVSARASRPVRRRHRTVGEALPPWFSSPW